MVGMKGLIAQTNHKMPFFSKIPNWGYPIRLNGPKRFLLANSCYVRYDPIYLFIRTIH
jgi:hypothetical protein